MSLKLNDSFVESLFHHLCLLDDDVLPHEPGPRNNIILSNLHHFPLNLSQKRSVAVGLLKFLSLSDFKLAMDSLDLHKVFLPSFELYKPAEESAEDEPAIQTPAVESDVMIDIFDVMAAQALVSPAPLASSVVAPRALVSAVVVDPVPPILSGVEQRVTTYAEAAAAPASFSIGSTPVSVKKSVAVPTSAKTKTVGLQKTGPSVDSGIRTPRSQSRVESGSSRPKRPLSTPTLSPLRLVKSRGNITSDVPMQVARRNRRGRRTRRRLKLTTEEVRKNGGASSSMDGKSVPKARSLVARSLTRERILRSHGHGMTPNSGNGFQEVRAKRSRVKHIPSQTASGSKLRDGVTKPLKSGFSPSATKVQPAKTGGVSLRLHASKCSAAIDIHVNENAKHCSIWLV